MRLDQLTFTRFVAAILIVMYHFLPHDHAILNNSYVSFLISESNVMVSYFFILSGFVMIIAYGTKPIEFTRYYVNRFARIYPAYFIALLCVLAHNTMSSSEIRFSEVFTNLLAIQSWIPGLPLTLNFPGWSISTEFFFYASFPLLLSYFYNKFSLKSIAICIIAFWLITQIVLNVIYLYIDPKPRDNLYDVLYYFPVSHFNEFLIGNLAGILFIKYNKRLLGKFNTIVLLTVISLLYYFVMKSTLPIYLHNGLLAVLFVPFIFLLSMDSGILYRTLTNKICIFLGEISFGIYIYQKPVNLFFYSIIVKRFGIAYDFWLFLFLLIIISAISFLYIETPAQMWLRRLLSNKNKGISRKLIDGAAINATN